MADSLPSAPLFANLQADPAGTVKHTGKRASKCRQNTQARQCPKEDQEKSEGLHAVEGWRRIWPHTLIINWDCFPFKKIVMTEQNLGSWSLDTSPSSPQIASFSEKNNFPFSLTFSPHLLAFEQWADQFEFSNSLGFFRAWWVQESQTSYLTAQGSKWEYLS